MPSNHLRGGSENLSLDPPFKCTSSLPRPLPVPMATGLIVESQTKIENFFFKHLRKKPLVLKPFFERGAIFHLGPPPTSIRKVIVAPIFIKIGFFFMDGI